MNCESVSNDHRFLLFVLTSNPESTYVALHTEKPDKDGNLFDYAPNYEGYFPVEIPRNEILFEVDEEKPINTKDIKFPECKYGSDIITHYSISMMWEGRWMIYAIGRLNFSLTIFPGITPTFLVGNLNI